MCGRPGAGTGAVAGSGIVCPLLRSAKVVKVLLASLWFLFNCKIPWMLWTNFNCRPVTNVICFVWFYSAARPRQGKLFMAQVEWGESFLIYLLEPGDGAGHRQQTILYGLMMIIKLLGPPRLLGFMSAPAERKLIQIGSAVSWLWQVPQLNILFYGDEVDWLSFLLVFGAGLNKCACVVVCGRKLAN